MAKTIEVTIEARHGEGAAYLSNDDCALARSLKESGYKHVHVLGQHAFIGASKWRIQDPDKKLQEACNLWFPKGRTMPEFPFTITLTETE